MVEGLKQGGGDQGQRSTGVLLKMGSSHCGAVETNPTSIQEDTGLIPGLAHQIKDLALP